MTSKTSTKKETGKKQKLVLLDTHAIIHRAYHALPDFASSNGTPTGALYGLSTMLMKIISDIQPNYIVACYDLPQKTFRHEAYDDYKGGRKKTDDALIEQLKQSRRIFEAFSIPMYDMPGFEADDMLGTIVEKLKNNKEIEIVIASGDMDTLQLVSGKKVQVYTLKKGISDTIVYDEDGVVERFGFSPLLLPDYKGLRGDPSDNIIGIAGIGEKTATTLISSFGSIENIYKKLKKDEQAFLDVGITKRIIGLLKEGEEEALFSKTLATIRRDAPIDFVVPAVLWKEALSLDNIEALFRELEFKNLFDRLQRLVSGEKGIATPKETSKEEVEIIDELEFKKISIATWLLNSELTNPDIKDIVHFSGAKNFTEARGIILKQLAENKLLYVYENIELPLIPILKRMEERGILLDTLYLKKLSEKHHKELEALEKKIWNHAGEEFNINSPKQLGDILFDKMALTVKGLKKSEKGARSTRISELEKLQGLHPIIDEIMGYRELQKMLSTYIDPLPLLADREGRIHTTFVQSGTTTGRFSSQNPNLQNIPIRSELGRNIRCAFVAAPRHKFVSLDYSQIELRVAALMSGDDYLIKVFNEKGDIHSAVASRVFGVPENEVTSDMRRKAKVINFGIIYGMGVTALKDNLKTTRAEAQEFYDNYFRQFPRIHDYLEEVKMFAKKHGYTETIFGRRRYFPAIASHVQFIRAMAERMATNAPLQGTAADIIKISIRRAEAELEKAGLSDKAHLLLQVHDELVYEIEEDVVEKASKIIKDAMEYGIPEEYLNNRQYVAFEVHVSVKDNWGDMK